MNESGYPVRGWLNGLVEGTCEIEEVEVLINGWLEESCRKGYKEGRIDGVTDTMIQAGKLSLEGREGISGQSELKPSISGMGSELESLENPFLHKVIKSFSEVATTQEEKGIKKYGHELRPLDNYDWLEMAMEELVDAV